MHTAFHITLVLVFLGITGPITYQYWRFRHTPQRVWWSRLRARRSLLLARRAVLLDGPESPKGTLRQLRTELLDDLFFSTKVRDLDTPRFKTFGIGPGLLDTLEGANIVSVWHMQRTEDFRVLPGIGDSRAYDLRRLLSKVEELLVADFEAGQCPQGVKYLQHHYACWAEYDQVQQAYRAELKVIETIIEECEQLKLRAANLTFIGHLVGRPHGVTSDTLASPLPGAEWA